MSSILQFLSDDAGNLSFIRLIAGIVTLVIVLTWSILCFINREYQPINLSDVLAILGLGVIKVWQKTIEVNNTHTP